VGSFFVTHVTVNPITARHTRSRSTAHSATIFGGGQIVFWFFILAGAAESPFAFTHLWERKWWFRVLWWIAIAMVIAGIVNLGG
jgi:hypothetical protein